MTHAFGNSGSFGAARAACWVFDPSLPMDEMSRFAGQVVDVHVGAVLVTRARVIERDLERSAVQPPVVGGREEYVPVLL